MPLSKVTKFQKTYLLVSTTDFLCSCCIRAMEQNASLTFYPRVSAAIVTCVVLANWLGRAVASTARIRVRYIVALIVHYSYLLVF